MSLRFTPLPGVVAAFVAATLALMAAGVLAVRSADEYAAREARVDARLESAHIVSRLSSTIDAARRQSDAIPVTSSVEDALAALVRERAQARRDFEGLKAWAALLAALGVVALALACAAMRAERARRIALETRLRSEQTHDALTGLPNGRFFAEWLAFAIAHARREDVHVGVLFIDIGGCAAVAEHHGGQAAEALLVEIARRFRASAREGDVFARLAATQFALATPNAHHMRDLATIAQRLRDVLDDPGQPPLADSPIGTSIGIAFFPEDAGDSAGVMAAANAAMFAARRAGRNHVAFNALAA
jgi:diguanylate cyclase (GGDEF)-like protein